MARFGIKEKVAKCVVCQCLAFVVVVAEINLDLSPPPSPVCTSMQRRKREGGREDKAIFAAACITHKKVACLALCTSSCARRIRCGMGGIFG